MTRRSDNSIKTPAAWRKLFICCGVFVLTGAMVLLLARKLDWFGEWYASKVFPIFPYVIGRVASPVPFSVLEIGIYALAVFFLIHIGYFIFLIIAPHRRAKLKKAVTGFLSAALLFVCAVFMMLSLTCTVNYERETFAELTGRQLMPSSKEDLLKLCGILIRDAEEASAQTGADERGVFTIRGVDLNKEAKEAMKLQGTKIKALAGYYPNPKPVLSSKFMSKINLTGIYSPFTLEANYNRDVPNYLIPYTVCHELAHLKGFIREDEAGFIAYLACRDSRSPEFRYSGAMNALSYTLNTYYRETSKEEYDVLLSELPKQTARDFAANYEYWQSFRGRVSDIANKANDRYLKANAQYDGVKSYGRMVDLLLAEYR